MNILNYFFGSYDAYSFIWYLWHAQEALRHLNFSELLYTKMMFYPYGVDLTFDIHLLYTFISYPIYLFFGPFAAYNFIIILTFVLTFWGMYLFLKLISKSQTAGIVGALMFTFSSYRLQRMMVGHMDQISNQGIGFFLYFGYKYFYFGKNRINLVGMTVVYLLQAYTDYRTFLILTFIGGYFMIGELYKSWIGKKLAETLKQLSSYFIIILISLLPLLSLYYSVVKFDFRTDQLDISDIKMVKLTDLVEYIWPQASSTLYLGWASLGLGIWYLFTAKKSKEENKWIKFWGVFAFLFFLMTLGSGILVGKNVLLESEFMPFVLFSKIPVLKFLHKPKRFGVVIFFYLALVATFAYKKLTSKLSERTKKYLFISLSFLVVFQHVLFIPIVIVKEEDNSLLKSIKSGQEGAVLTIPFGYFDAFSQDTKYLQQRSMVLQIFHQKPILSGYVTYQTPQLYEKFINNSAFQKIYICQETGECNSLQEVEKTDLIQNFGVKYIYISENSKYPQVDYFIYESFPQATKKQVQDDILYVL